VRALRHVAIVSQRKATTGDAHVNRNAAKHTLHLALDVAERYAHLAIAPRHRHRLAVSLWPQLPYVAAAVLTHRRSIIVIITTVRVGLEWRLYFLLELAKLAWEEHNLAQALKYIAQAKQIATQADQPHFLVPTPSSPHQFLRSLPFNVTFHVVARPSSFWWKRTWRLLDETSAPWCSTCSSTNKHTTPAPKARFRPRTPQSQSVALACVCVCVCVCVSCVTADAGVGEE